MNEFDLTLRNEENEIGTAIIKTAFLINGELGPGLLESVYERILYEELKSLGLQVQSQINIPIRYKGLNFDTGFRADLIVGQKVLVELKSVDEIANVHYKQLLTYLRLTNFKLGYIINFGSATMKEGIKRVANGL